MDYDLSFHFFFIPGLPPAAYSIPMLPRGALPSPRPVGESALSGEAGVGGGCDLEEAGTAVRRGSGEKRTRRPWAVRYPLF